MEFIVERRAVGFRIFGGFVGKKKGREPFLFLIFFFYFLNFLIIYLGFICTF